MADPTATQAPSTVPPERPSPEPQFDSARDSRAVIDRIEDALTRIDTAVRARADHTARMEQRHATLRQKMTETIATLDTILAAVEDSAEQAGDA